MNNWDHFARADPAGAAKLVKALRGRIVAPHDGGQSLIVASDARFRVVRAGRRFGKTKIAAREVVTHSLAGKDQVIWWVANTYKNVRRGYRQVVAQIPQQLFAKDPPPSGSNELVLKLTNGTTIEFYSGGNPDAMAGEGVHFVVVDEAALMPGHVWHQTIRPTLADTKGGALIISTPRGRNWFYDLWQRGQNEQWPSYASWHFSMRDNPYVDDEEVEELKASLPETLFRQEIMAEFLENASAIFNMEKVKVVEPGVPAGHIVVGIDLAKHQDFTVIRASGPDRIPVFHERFKGISWPAQRERIIDIIRELEAWPDVEAVTIGIDTGGPGDVIFDELDEQGFDVEPVKFGSPGLKDRMVRLLGSDLEAGHAFILPQQAEEFRMYEYSITPTGTMTYSAPEGKHDDEVAATMIEQWVARYRAPGAAHGYEEQLDIEQEEADLKTVMRPDHAKDIMARDDAWH